MIVKVTNVNTFAQPEINDEMENVILGFINQIIFTNLSNGNDQNDNFRLDVQGTFPGRNKPWRKAGDTDRELERRRTAYAALQSSNPRLSDEELRKFHERCTPIRPVQPAQTLFSYAQRRGQNAAQGGQNETPENDEHGVENDVFLNLQIQRNVHRGQRQSTTVSNVMLSNDVLTHVRDDVSSQGGFVTFVRTCFRESMLKGFRYVIYVANN